MADKKKKIKDLDTFLDYFVNNIKSIENLINVYFVVKRYLKSVDSLFIGKHLPEKILTRFLVR
jgi:hypothetical protein